MTDLTKTILNLTGAKDPGELPGLDLMDHEAMMRRETVFVEAYTHDIADLANPVKSLFTQVVIDGWWKLLIPDPSSPKRPFATAPKGIELYDLKADPYEKVNLAEQHPDVVMRLKQLQVARWKTDSEASK